MALADSDAIRQCHRPVRPISDLAGYFSGVWHIERRILDRRQGMTGRLTGAATFLPSPDGLAYMERGTLILGNYRGEVSQHYDWRLKEAGLADIHFSDGRAFHALDLSAGYAFVAHDCGQDRYAGRYVIDHATSWRLGWRIDGPRKQQVIVTRFRRAAPPGTAR
jgi:hypothetical protein